MREQMLFENDNEYTHTRAFKEMCGEKGRDKQNLSSAQHLFEAKKICVKRSRAR